MNNSHHQSHTTDPDRSSLLEAQDFQNLVRDAKAGDEAAFARLYERSITPIYRFVYLRVKRKEEAEELTQVVFMKAWQALPRYVTPATLNYETSAPRLAPSPDRAVARTLRRPRGETRNAGDEVRNSKEETPFLAWLYTIARNTVIDHWKKKKELHIESQEEYFANIADTALTPKESAEQKENAQRIRAAIQTLSEDQQEIIILKYIEDLSNKEISAITGKSEDAIRQMQFRAFKILKRHFKSQDL